MNAYYRGYLLGDLRRFPAWPQAAGDGAERAERAGPAELADLADDTVVYLRDDFAVVRSPVAADQGLLWDAATPQWLEFCDSVLRFSPRGL